MQTGTSESEPSTLGAAEARPARADEALRQVRAERDHWASMYKTAETELADLRKSQDFLQQQRLGELNRVRDMAATGESRTIVGVGVVLATGVVGISLLVLGPNFLTNLAGFALTLTAGLVVSAFGARNLGDVVSTVDLLRNQVLPGAGTSKK